MKGRLLFSVCLFLLAVRLIWLIFYFTKETSPPFEKPLEDGQKITLTGEIYRVEKTEKTQILYLKHNSIYQGKTSFPISNCIVYDLKKEIYPIGNRIQMKGEVKLFEHAPNPGNFDQKWYYQKDGISFSCFAQDISVKNKKIKQPDWFFYQLRESWSKMLIREMGEKHGGTMSAMLLGQKRVMDPEEKERYQKSGIGHPLAVSGLHVSFVGLSFYHLLRRMGVGFYISSVAGISLLLAYGFLVGFGVSVIRAVIMLGLRIGAALCGREYDFLTAVGCAAVWTAWTKPLYVLDAGFLLSYTAVIGIYAGNELLKKYFAQKGTIWKNFLIGLFVQAALFPLMIYYFYEFSLYSVFLNLLAIPGASIVIGNGLISSLICMFTGCGAGLWINRGLLEIYSRVSEMSLEIPFSRMIFGRPKWYEIVFYVFAFIWGYHRLKNEKTKWIFPACLLAISLIFLKQNPYPKDEVKVTMINVGQGDGILIQSPDKRCYLVDGGSSDVTEVGKYRIEPFLKYLGIQKIDGVFLSHADEDHINGIFEMLGRQNVGVKMKKIILESHSIQDEGMKKLIQKAKKEGIDVKRISCGQRIGEKVSLECIGPQEGSVGKDGNETSMVLRLEYGAMSMLFTGDIGAETEKAMGKRGVLEKTTILKTAHHGSKGSTSETFLKAVQPKTALISAGKENPYGHPSKETLEQFQKSDIPYYITSREGAISVKLEKERFELYKYRKKSRPFPF